MQTLQAKKTILDTSQYILIYRVAWLSLLSAIYSFYMKQYNLAIVPSSVFIASRLYWYKPDYSWRRYFDMTVIKACVVYQLSLAYKSEYAAVYYPIALTGLVFYPIGIYFYSKHETWASTYSHLAMHVILNIGNIVLYSSKPIEGPLFSQGLLEGGPQ